MGDTVVFQNIARRRYEARACTAKQDHRLLAKCAGDLVTANKERLFLARSMWNYVIFCVRSHNRYLFRSSYNTLAGLCISSSYAPFFYTT